MSGVDAPQDGRLERDPDSSLARAARAGDRAALTALLTRHRQVVFGIASRILSDRADALDATQEACVRIWRFLGSYDPERPFAAWVRTVAVRAALDQARRTRPFREEAGVDVPDPAGGPLEAAHRAEAGRAVTAALASLSPRQRAAFVCREIEGMEMDEVAAALGCLAVTARWHLFEARKRLAAALAPFEGGLP